LLACFELFQALLIWVEKLFMLFDQDHVYPHIYAIPTLGIHIHICIPFIIALWESKLPLYAVIHQKRGMGYRKKWERIKEQKALVLKKRESEKKKVAMPSQKEAREGKLLKEVPLPPNMPHTCTCWSICMTCCSLWSKCLT
jgi:hypothetical protein